MASAFTDSPPLLKTLLSSNWVSANTDAKTPNFVVPDDQSDANVSKRYDAGMYDFVTVYLVSVSNPPSGIGGTRREKHDRLAVEVRSAQTRAHHMKVIAEVDRILDAHLKNPFSGYKLLNIGEWIKHEDSVRFWRHSKDVEAINFAVTRGS